MGIVIVVLDLKDDTGQLHIINFEQVYYFSGAPKLLVRPKNGPGT